jgi:uncharacterized protein
MMDDNEIHVVETTPILPNVDIVIGIPDVGLVGPIAATHIIESLKLPDIGYFESKIFPPVTVVHDHIPKSPVRLYGNEKLVVLVAEMPIAPYLVYPLADALIKWFLKKKPHLIISLGGVARQDRVEVETPDVFGLPTDEEVVGMLKNSNIKVFEEGLLVGSYGTILKDCMRANLHSVYLMAEAHMKYPDPGAAASAISAVNRLIGTKIDVSVLKEKSEEIRVRARDLMKRTGSNMDELQKVQEQEIPMMYR